MRLGMSERRAVVKAFAQQYQRGSKKARSEVLDGFVTATGYSRSYASWLLRWHGKRVRIGERVVVIGDATKRVKRRRKRAYGAEVVAVVTKLWKLLDWPAGKRLAAALPGLVEALERHGELSLRPQVRRQVLSISAATIDRVLAPERQRIALRGRSRTKPGTLLKHQVPLRTFAEWNEHRPGFAELDLVAHDGGVARGEYVQTLNLTDVATGWTELAAVPTRAQVWVFEALKAVRARVPFPLLGIDSDNGGEFINKHLIAYCAKERITFTRSRPYRKNDSCFVEQKNWSVVRRFVGYGRLEGEQQRRALDQLYAVLRLQLNFFAPSMKLVEKTRHGSRVTKRYDRPQTPYARVLASPTVSDDVKNQLHTLYSTLNPAALARSISILQRRLAKTPVGAPPSRAVEAMEIPPPPPSLGIPTAPTAPTTPTQTHPHSFGVDFS
jgi:Integrase core domain